MASIKGLLSVLVLVASAQSAAVLPANPMGMAGAGASAGLGLANSGVSAGLGMANSGMDMAGSAMGMGSSAMAAGTSAAGSISGRMIKEAKTFNGNLQNALGAQLNGGANIVNALLKVDAEILERLGPMLKSIATLTGATTEQMLLIMRDVMTGGPLKSAELIQKTLTYMAEKKRQVGAGIVSKTSSFTEGMREKSFAPLNMLENMNNFLQEANQYTSAVTGRSPASASASAAAALTPPIP
ncbi:hypothetical protein LSTR_LSTR003641 [Laodelphax striatellus]|uniref:Uncharacterized protein n=1 Tax=Laodelphax striatellus TaxID=195883 RepID=A0A482XAU5_LAOST|nr:hypothetical protein LSTR_LSTR003641 [Laodelphax striatellus]